jgi:Protein kinase domain
MVAKVSTGLGNIRGRAESANPPPKKKRMQKLSKFNRGRIDKNDRNDFINEINALVKAYNQSEDDEQKVQLIKQMQSKINDIDYKYRPSELAASSAYVKARNKFFQQMQYQLQSLGVDSLLDPKDNPSSLSELIANMSPEKADKLAGILIKGEKSDDKLFDELLELYKPRDKSDEAKRYKNFLKTYRITFLGGGNSKNYKVENYKTGDIEVLKVDCRLNMPRGVEQHLREKLGDKLTPNRAERSVVCEDPKTSSNVSRTLLVTEFCQSGSILDLRNKMIKERKTYDDLREKSADVFEKMTDVFMQIQKNDCIFPDAKLTNWLVDNSGNVRIADTKSFLFTDEDGNYSKAMPENKRYGLLSTPSFNPPEYNHSKINADSAHAYMLGINLYVFMTGGVPKEKDAKDFDFSSQAFKGEKGEKIKSIIQSLVKESPEARMSVKDAHIELKALARDVKLEKNHEAPVEKKEKVVKSFKAFKEKLTSKKEAETEVALSSTSLKR